MNRFEIDSPSDDQLTVSFITAGMILARDANAAFDLIKSEQAEIYRADTNYDLEAIIAHTRSRDKYALRFESLSAAAGDLIGRPQNITYDDIQVYIDDKPSQPTHSQN